MAAHGYGLSLWGNENVLESESGDGCTPSDGPKTPRTVYFKRVKLWYVSCISIMWF